MNPELHARAKALFLDACDLDPARRARFLDAACATDADLRAAVDELLASDAEPHALLSAADAGGAARWLALGLAQVDELSGPVPERIGPYRVVRLLGRGGMGAVFEAEQQNPARRVAIKVLGSWLGSTQQLARFRQEAQLLGRLNHPGIAHVYEAGTAQIQGSVQPFIAMELVEGATLLEHARRAGLDLAGRLDLILQVCDAVQHAHAQGILHRDLKPTNIAVDAAGRAKVLDFGLARALQDDSGAARARTATGLVVGTLGTMSPEQVSGRSDRLDERSDVYSLGVIAYELLTGFPPLDVSQVTLPQAAQMICEATPPPAGRHDRALRGDLETILAKALAKDRSERYGSARELADDLRRYLQAQPILARAPSTIYQLRMFARRNRALVTGMVVAAAALFAGAVAAGWFAWNEKQLRELADREAYRANVVAAGMALENGNPNHARALLQASAGRRNAFEWRRVERQLEQWTAAYELGVRSSQAGWLDGERSVFAVGADGSVRIWDAASGAQETALEADASRRGALAVGPDGATIVSLQDASLVVWETRTGRERQRLAAPAGLADDPRGVAAFSPDGRWLAAGGRLFDLSAPGREARVVLAGSSCFDATGRRLAIAKDPHVVVVDTETGAELRRVDAPGPPRAIALDATGRWLAASDRAQVHLFDLEHGTVRVLAAVQFDVAVRLAFRPDGLRLAGLQDDGSFWIHDLARDRVERRAWVGQHSWHATLQWSADGARILTAAWTSGTVRTWDALETAEVLRGHASYVYPVAYTPDGTRLVSGSWDRTARVWSVATGRALATLAGHAGRVHALALAPDGTRLATGSDDGALVLWDARTGAQIVRKQAAGTWHALAWRPDGAEIAAALANPAGSIHLLSAADLATHATLEEDRIVVNTLAYAPDGRSLAIGDAAGNLRVRDTATGRERAAALGSGAAQCVAFSPDGRELAVATGSGRIFLLVSAALDRRRNLIGHAREAFAVAWSPDGARIASGGRDGRLRIWDAATGDLVGSFEGHGEYIWSVAFHPDGTRIATGSGDGTVRQWESEPAAVTSERRRAAERREIEAGPRVARVLAELGDPARAAERILADSALDPGERVAGLDELLRRAADPR